jgi:hypothetical protein
MRYAMTFVIAGLYVPLFLLYFINIDKGLQEAKDVLQQEIEAIQLSKRNGDTNESLDK